jgi:hypothetical protein
MIIDYCSHAAALCLTLCIELPAHVIYKTIVNDSKERFLRHSFINSNLLSVIDGPKKVKAAECNNNGTNGDVTLALQNATTKC